MDLLVDPAVVNVLAGRDAIDALLSGFAAELRELAGRQLSGPSGQFLLAGAEQLAEPAARSYLMNIAGLLGDLMPQDFKGELVRAVADRGAGMASGSSVRYSETRQGGSLHSDGCHHQQVPDLFALHCVRQARSGGALLLVHVDDLLTELSAEPAVLDALRLPVHFDSRIGPATAAPRTVCFPVLDLSADAVRIYYMRDYIDSAQQQPGVPPLTVEQRRAFDVLDGLLNRPELQRRRRLRPGETIIVNNHVMLHGRTAFPAEAGPGRLLLRCWITAPGPLRGLLGARATRRSGPGSR